MRAGRLDRRITLEAESVSPNGFGEAVRSYGSPVTVWASVNPIKAEERFQSDAIRASRTSKFIIRWQTGITETMRILYDSQYYRIVGLAELGRRQGIEITAELFEKHGGGI